MLKKPIVYIIFLITILIGGGLLYGVNQLLRGSGKEYIVELRKDGFYPGELIIRTGDTVTFTSSRPEAFWPASDPHPIHDYLSALDPGRPVPPDNEWSYTFQAPGTWRYHDHLEVSSRGEITVLNVDSNLEDTAAVVPGKYCEGKCFDELIKHIVKKEGIEAAYAFFTKKFASGKLPAACHWTAHQIGEAAYEIFREGETFPITYATSYCAYGFYHGFLESLLRENPDVDYALSFCERVEEQLGERGLWNCYHGIGHGFTEDPPDPLVWGDFEAMIKPGIEMCEFLFGDSFRDLSLCLTGVFTVPAGFALEGKYGLSLDLEDPFTYCQSQPYRYHKACYGEFAPKLANIIDSDFSRLPKYIEKIKDEKTRRLVLWVVPSVMMERDIMNNDHSSYIYGCRENFTGRLRNICFGGAILGFFPHGEPERQYVKLLRFCASGAWSSDEQELCYAEALRQMRQRYTHEKMNKICELVPSTYQRHCLKQHFEAIYNDPSFDEISIQ
ncbi:hypothetical protein IIA95_03060 [Patescibacteria group bacterium]|nr:hypothetical protein [Patescibacteria group bacterium]